MYATSSLFRMTSSRGKRAATPAIIGGDEFNQLADLTRLEIQKLIVATPDEAGELLTRWNGGAIIILHVKLSNDNSSVVNCSVKILGTFFKDARQLCAANGVWESCPTLSISLGAMEGAAFEFLPGSTTSTLVDSSRLDFNYMKDGTILTAEQATASGLNGFSLRLYVVPSAADWARIIFVLYPLPLVALLEGQPLASDTRFPGVNLYTNDFSLEPNARQVLGRSWGSPIVPVISPGAPLDATLPSSHDLRAAIAETLRATTRPEVRRGFPTLNPRWLALAKDGENQLKSPSLDLLWPPAQPPVPAPRGTSTRFIPPPPPPPLLPRPLFLFIFSPLPSTVSPLSSRFCLTRRCLIISLILPLF